MHGTRICLAAAVLAFSLAGCGDDDGDDGDATGDPVASARAESEQLQQQSVEAATVDALFGALCSIRFSCGGINKELEANPSKATADARAICAEIEAGNENKARAEVRKRFSNDKFQATDQHADDVVHILRTKICEIL